MRYLALIPLVPALGALVNGVLGVAWFPKRVSGLLACASVGVSFLLSVAAFVGLLGLPPAEREYTQVIATWLPPLALQTATGMGTFTVDWALRLDPLAAVMLLVVTGIGLLIHVYAVGYMQEETPGAYARFFCYLNLFVFFMLTLVLGANFLVLFVGWEGVGLCSYLLIGYWYQKDSAANAGKKAFLTNRIGDFGFILGVFLVFQTFGTLDFRAVQDAAASMPVETASFGVLSLICLLLFVGATGKSAQIPLYVWLPDAMEGPTPVSALIHAATMVTAGVYMVCRNAVLFSHAPLVLETIAIVGVLTALVAASIGLVQNDIKRVLAYSTVSQLGYMFLATGVGAFAAGAFHLMTHAFFKALLFLGSGSVIHGLGGEQDLRRMGDLRRYMPVTFATMMVGTLAIAGIPPLSGFFSKDEILYRTFEHDRLLWALAAITALMTAFYMFRLMALTFYGPYRGPAFAAQAHGHDHAGHGAGPGGGHDTGHDPHGHGAAGWHGPHESPKVMTYPLVVLAAGAVVAGVVGLPPVLGGSAFERFLEPSFRASPAVAVRAATVGAAHDMAATAPADLAGGNGRDHAGLLGVTGPADAPPGEHADAHGASHAALELTLMALSVALAVAGILGARHVYLVRPELAPALAARFPRLYRVLLNKYYVDEAYGATVVAGTMAAASGSWRFDRAVIDGAVDGSGWLTRALSWLSGVLDRTLVDGAVNFVGGALAEASRDLRRLQTGLIQNYALLMLAGLFAFVSVYVLWR